MIFRNTESSLITNGLLIRRIVATAFSRGIATAGTFLFTFVAAKLLPVREFGDFMLLYSIIVGLGFFSQFGIQQAAVRFAGILYADKAFSNLRDLKTGESRLTLASSTLLSFIVILAGNHLLRLFFESPGFGLTLTVMTVSLPFYARLGIHSAYLKAFRQPEKAPLYEPGFSLVLTSVLALFLYGIGLKIHSESLSLLFFLSVCGSFILGSLKVSSVIGRKTDRSITSGNNRNFFRTLPDFASLSIMSYLLQYSPVVILGILDKSEAVGIYTASQQIALTIGFAMIIVNTVAAPYFAVFFERKQKGNIIRLVKKSIVFMLIPVLPLFIVIFLYAPEILSFFGTEYVSGSISLRVLASAQFFNILTGPLYFLMAMTGHEKELRNTVFLSGIISIVSSILLIPALNHTGAAIAMSLGIVIQKILLFLRCFRIFRS